MTKILYSLIIGLFFSLFYIVYNQNVKIESPKEYKANAVVYSKAMCIYCINAKNLLKQKNISYNNIDLGENVALHRKLIDETNQTTVPYIFINEKFIGGYTELENLERTKELDLLLNSKD